MWVSILALRYVISSNNLPPRQMTYHHVQQHIIFVRHGFTPLTLMTVYDGLLRFLSEFNGISPVRASCGGWYLFRTNYEQCKGK